MNINNPSPGGGRRRVRMRDVANRCNVSISTVSLVLSGDPRIPEDTAQKVLQAVKAMEYRPSVIARSLARRISRTIGVILPELGFSKNQAFYYQALEGIHAQTQPAGFKMVVEAANKGFIERRYHHRLLKEQSADAVIFLAAGIKDEYLSEMETEAYPFILVGSYSEGVDLPCARSDDKKGGRLATEHLIKRGHKAVGHIRGPINFSYGKERWAGYEEAMKAAGLPIKEEWIQDGDNSATKSEQAAMKLVSAGVTAIFAGADVMAYGALGALKKLNKKVPQEIAVVGMDDLEMSAWTNPGLTTVRYDIKDMANKAANLMIKQIQSPLVKADQLGPMPEPELIIRESCGSK